jgi:glutathione S-transferase
MATKTITLYDYPTSGHAHRVRNFLAMLGVDYETITINIRENEHKHPDYLKISPLGQVPTLIVGDLILTDSTAALVYLALRYADERWLPRDPAGAAKVQRWLSAASGEVYRGPVLARAARIFGRDVDVARAEAESVRLFNWMQGELAGRQWLAAAHATIADVAMYSYISVANEGGLDLSDYPAIRRWLGDVTELAGFIPMPRSED